MPKLEKLIIDEDRKSFSIKNEEISLFYLFPIGKPKTIVLPLRKNPDKFIKELSEKNSLLIPKNAECYSISERNKKTPSVYAVQFYYFLKSG